ncbi:Crp/Fnr family transcriptional regulator [Hydrogenophaga sp.]|uniref:Crp/Fnr family transcriptional regulator n=1 Tax=Hydrogenophaga sp. TaxID=1904254 RepID=UPI003F6BB66D
MPVNLQNGTTKRLGEEALCRMPLKNHHTSFADLLQLLGVEGADLAAAAQMPMVLRRVHAGESLAHEGTPADAIFFVCAGTFKIFRTNEDGYEQVLAFAIRGEVLGFDALCMDSYPTAVSALEESSVYVVLKRDVFALSQLIASFGLALQRAGSMTLARSRELVELLAAVASEVKLARFLIQLSRRMAGCGQSPRRFHLRMGRREIASLLGVAHETVSRSFSALAALGMVEVSDREVEILDMEGLKRFARSTRRHLDEPAVSRARRPAAKRSAPVRHAMAQSLAA